ncbi:hypothetical protein DACRYDRAFT_108575 [Dacryopinax primogenitus]|uniref:HNH nuclease domain-containing protein n=1 Tax=Dacryopinax primogenitus (strain DJM 731) TaxID=1858805 RepID=M5G9L6_DACPD|nr:uncharacterized protein DACRYDRAFT_108575 [Dacryopinax primogenitus]EJU00508.1 hypothetical protein DACRYDRAFT_108575 [Dacryopinax primogenitus]
MSAAAGRIWPPEDINGRLVLNLDVIRERPSQSSHLSTRDKRFTDAVGQRDKVCILSGRHGNFCEAQHLVHRHIGNQGMADILSRNSPQPLDSNFEPIREVDDPRNGVFMDRGLHSRYDAGALAIMITPNCVLDTSDIVAPAPRILEPGTACPAHVRYTAQWFDMASFDEDVVDGVPENTDAALGLSLLKSWIAWQSLDRAPSRVTMKTIRTKSSKFRGVYNRHL